MCYNGGAQELVMGGQHAGVAVPEVMKQAGAALDIREQEGDGPGRQRRHGRFLRVVPAGTWDVRQDCSRFARAAHAHTSGERGACAPL